MALDMNSTTSLPGMMANNESTMALDTRLHSVSTGISSPGLDDTSTPSLVSKLTTMVTETIGNDTLNFNSSYSPGNWSSPVNVTRIPIQDEDMGIKRVVVIVTEIFVVVAIIITCLLAVRHRRWEQRVRSEREKDPISDYDLVDIEEEEEIDEDYELFDK